MANVKRRHRTAAAAILVPTTIIISIAFTFSQRHNENIHSQHVLSVSVRATSSQFLPVTVRAPSYDKNFCHAPNTGDVPTNFLRSSNRIWLLVLLPAVAFLFCGLAVVTDVYFVASLERICECLKLSDDVAGATFMAAGSSAPELFTSLLSTLKNGDDLGVGTIVGSAVFNICVIVGVSAFFAGAPLALDPLPLARDSVFYALSVLIMLLVLLLPGSRGKATWVEGALMIVVYAGYIAFMAFANKPYLRWAKGIVKSVRGTSSDEDTASRLENGTAGCSLFQSCRSNPEPCTHITPVSSSSDQQTSTMTSIENRSDLVEVTLDDESEEKNETEPEPEPENNERMFLGVPLPTTKLEWILAPVLFPWQFVLAWTIPNCSRQKWKNLWPITFVISVLWIMGVSYLMVEATRLSGCFIGIPSAVMGLTFLAAGTSVPDALASISVARAGRADMAVSNAIGSNVFDILLGLGLPWLIAGAAKAPVEISVEPVGLVVIPIVILFVFLVLLIAALVICKWKLSRTLGVILFTLYAAFVAYSLLDVWVFKIGQ